MSMSLSRWLLVLLVSCTGALLTRPAAADTVLITGANSGIGLEFARQYAAQGWTVIATHRHDGPPESLVALNKQYPKVAVERMDVQSVAEVHALAAKLKGRPIDVLINNAGIFSLGDWLDRKDTRQHFGTLDYDSFDQFMEINVRGPILVSESFIDNVRAGHGKRIVAISSSIGTISTPDVAVNAFWYGTSKAALNKVMATLSSAVKSEGIIVVPMHPGAVRVEKQASVHVPGMIETPDSVAKMIATIGKLTPADSGQFTLYDGSRLPW